MSLLLTATLTLPGKLVSFSPLVASQSASLEIFSRTAVAALKPELVMTTYEKYIRVKINDTIISHHSHACS